MADKLPFDEPLEGETAKAFEWYLRFRGWFPLVNAKVTMREFGRLWRAYKVLTSGSSEVPTTEQIWAAAESIDPCTPPAYMRKWMTKNQWAQRRLLWLSHLADEASVAAVRDFDLAECDIHEIVVEGLKKHAKDGELPASTLARLYATVQRDVAERRRMKVDSGELERRRRAADLMEDYLSGVDETDDPGDNPDPDDGEE